ncbi:MAG: AbrB/MazE/SpoVT family DNA-binding domain-containing protein [Euryarchaeota archaeon]|nr:AbrB/MazE/SpoVT family DNA-binding domain-containing protein [Euryarchaeota archaeon]
MIETRISRGFQTALPARVRKQWNVGPEDRVIWTLVGGDLFVRFRKKTSGDPLLELIGKMASRGRADATEELDAVVHG